MTIAENQNHGNEASNEAESPKKGSFFTNEELDLLDIPEHGPGGGKNGQKMNASQTAIVVLVLTAIASFALGMLAERGIDSTSSVAGQGNGAGSLSGNSVSGSSANSINSQAQLNVPQTQPEAPAAK